MTQRPELAERLAQGDLRALARAISWVESGHPRAGDLLRALYSTTGRAITIGVTGFPGAGKSSLCDRLIEALRTKGKSVGVIAVDPSSAFSGGAILGDRIRMMRHSADPGVYIRSMATRGHLGGLARATADTVDLLDAAGKEAILIETVGVGQDEIDIARLADVVLVVLVPGMGDDIQAIKAGILEIADIFVINKADRDGADKLASELTQMLSLGGHDDRPRPPILPTVAISGQGVSELFAAIELQLAQPDHQQRRETRRRERARARLQEMLTRTLLERTLSQGMGRAAWEALIDSVARRETDPYTAVDHAIEAAWGKERADR